MLKDPEEFEQEYRTMLEWVQNKDNLAAMEDELRHRGVRVMEWFCREGKDCWDNKCC